MMGELMGVMVGHDAFTQALTNPLLAAHIFNEKTFTKTGLEIYRIDDVAPADLRTQHREPGPGRRSQFRLEKSARALA